mgnify:CR=1 FL=1
MDQTPPGSAALAPLPLELRVLDHYTLIVEDAAAVAHFHTEVLGFKPLRIQEVNTGSVAEGQFDMLNHVLQIPGTHKRVLVITEGLTEDSIFRRYLREYGPGVHHLAYEVQDLDGSLATLQAAGFHTTSNSVLKDPLTGLRQVFIDRRHAGYFVELIERTETADSGVFTHDNMAALARTMIQYLSAGDEPDTACDPRVSIAVDAGRLLDFLADPARLGQWTGHRNMRFIDDRWVELRMRGDIPFAIAIQECGAGCHEVRFRWSLPGESMEVVLLVTDAAGHCDIEARLPALEPARLARTRQLINTELAILAAILEGREHEISAPQRELVDAAHLEIYQRPGL